MASILATSRGLNPRPYQLYVVPPTGVEPATYGTGNRRFDMAGLTFPKIEG